MEGDEDGKDDGSMEGASLFVGIDEEDGDEVGVKEEDGSFVGR
jgi:hypothetical protein